MSGLLACPPEQPTRQATPTMVSYDVREVSEAEQGSWRKGPIHKNFRTPFSETKRNVYDLLTWPEGWNGYNAPKPNPASVAHARSWVEGLYRDVRSELWIKPHVIADEDGDVVFEWWKDRKKLTVYVSPETAEYVKVEKLGVSSKIEDGNIETPEKRRALWHWLLSA